MVLGAESQVSIQADSTWLVRLLHLARAHRVQVLVAGTPHTVPAGARAAPLHVGTLH
jgi:hypothetical protein